MSFLSLSTRDFFAGQVGGTIVRHSYSLSFFCGTPPSCLKVMGWWVAHEILVLAKGPLDLGFGVLGLRVWGQGLILKLQMRKFTNVVFQ